MLHRCFPVLDFSETISKFLFSPGFQIYLTVDPTEKINDPPFFDRNDTPFLVQ